MSFLSEGFETGSFMEFLEHLPPLGRPLQGLARCPRLPTVPRRNPSPGGVVTGPVGVFSW